jgi:hypothetical protein
MSNPAYVSPMGALVVDGEVVIIGGGTMCGAYTPEAVLASLEPLRLAAEHAIRKRQRAQPAKAL